MLTIKSVPEERRLAYAAEYGCPDVQGLIMRDGEEEAGGVVYTMTPDELRILRFWSEDPTLRDLLLRGTLNIGWRRGVKTVVCGQESLREFLQAEGFVPAEGGMQTGIAAFFAAPCRGCGEKS